MSELSKRKKGCKWTKAQLDELQVFCKNKSIKEIAEALYQGDDQQAHQVMWRFKITFKRQYKKVKPAKNVYVPLAPPKNILSQQWVY